MNNPMAYPNLDEEFNLRQQQQLRHQHQWILHFQQRQKYDQEQQLQHTQQGYYSVHPHAKISPSSHNGIFHNRAGLGASIGDNRSHPFLIQNLLQDSSEARISPSRQPGTSRSLMSSSIVHESPVVVSSPIARAAASAPLTSSRNFDTIQRSPIYSIAIDDAPYRVPTPKSISELDLYRLLKKANLLMYFRTFLAFGGDDVHQLINADEEEFLEIMGLVGMTQKPLHVRRLQRALLDLRTNRDDFQHDSMRYTQNLFPLKSSGEYPRRSTG